MFNWFVAYLDRNEIYINLRCFSHYAFAYIAGSESLIAGSESFKGFSIFLSQDARMAMPVKARVVKRTDLIELINYAPKSRHMQGH